MATNREILFLLGAGATVDAELPSATELTQVVTDSVSKKYASLIPVLRYISGAIEFGKGCRDEPLNGKINIEELLTACSFLSNRDKSYVYPFVGAWHEGITKLQSLPGEIGDDKVKDSFEFLLKFCKQGLRDWLKINNLAKIKYLRNFKDFINEGYKVRIFTLNYDECIERALRDELGPINEKWTNGFDETGWNPHRLDYKEYVAYLYKLHGSLDWVDDEKLGICSTQWPTAKDAEELPEDFDPLLIFGTDIKLQAVNPFLTLLFRFQEFLNTNELLVVIGYSFGDAYINAMIFKALQRNSTMRCIVVNTRKLDKLLPEDFRPLVAVRERFTFLERTAKDAFELNELLETVKNIFKDYEKELPF